MVAAKFTLIMKKITLLLFLFLVTAKMLQAQSDLLQRFSSTAVLDVDQLQMYNKISQFERFSTTKLIQINALTASVNQGGNLQINLAADEYLEGECQVLEFSPKVSRYIDGQNYYYYGTLLEGDSCDCQCQSGEIMIEATGGRKYGYFIVDEAHYEILAIDEAYSMLGRISEDYFADKQECLALEETEREYVSQETAAEARTGDNACVIRVLFLFTQAAEDRFGINGINDMVSLGISQTNQAFANSQISNVCVARANTREWEGFNENPLNIVQDMENLLTDNDVAQWRQDDLADVVCLITDAGYARLIGLSGTIPDPANPGQFITNLGNPMQDLAFMIVEGRSFTSRFTFSHELAHVIGCRHQTCATFDQDGCDDMGTFEHGHGWGECRCWLCKWRNYSTIMHQLRNNNTRLLRYSNPDLSHNGHPTGISNESDNASWIRINNGCTISNYNSVDPIFPLAVYILGENLLCKPFWGDFYAIATGSGSPYSYEWHVSTDGINWGMVAGTQQSISLNSNNYDTGSNVFLRVRVTNMLGNVEFAFFTVTIISPIDYAACYRYNDLVSEDDRAAVRVYPNPASDNLNVSLTVLEEESQVSIQLYTVTGVMVAEINQVLGAGEYNEVLPTKGVGAGSFLIRLKIGQKTHNKLIIKQ